jgi:hypothetical protein
MNQNPDQSSPTLEQKATIIHIDWAGPYSLSDSASLKGPTDYGVYQIYGAHHVYGSDVLLYIGRATHQTFATRIPQHGWTALTPDHKRVSYYVGRLFGYETPTDEIWCQHIDLAERLLIHAHSPAKNTQKELPGLEPDLWHVQVVNWRSYRDLLPEVTGARWTQRFDELSYDRHYNTDHFTAPTIAQQRPGVPMAPNP